MKIAVVGMGYVGLANAVMLSKKHEVIIVEINSQKVHKLNKSISPLRDNLIEDYLKNKNLNLSATIDHQSAYKNAEYVLICTPTNFINSQKSFDTSGIESILLEMSRLNFLGVIIIRSTVSIGFTENMQKKFKKLRIAIFPEFLREGLALEDSLSPSRIVCGSSDIKAIEFIEVLRHCADKKDIKALTTSPSEAEAIKLFANTYLAMRVSFFNELDTFAKSESLNTENIINGVSMDERIGNHYNNPSFGYGGYCLPKDSKQLQSQTKELPLDLIRSSISSNKKRKQYLVNEISLQSKGTIGIYRLAMKQGSDNLRESPLLWIIKALKKNKKSLLIFEPIITSKIFSGVEVVQDLDEFIKRSDLVVANRVDQLLRNKKAKIFTRDIFHEN